MVEPFEGDQLHAHRPLLAPLILVIAVVIGMTSGFALPTLPDTHAILWPAIFIQTVISVGGLHPNWIRSRRQRNDAFFLLGIHHLIGTVPYLLVWLLVSGQVRSEPVFISLICLAIVPTASGLPAYATAARASPVTITGFAFAGYIVSLLVTPVLAYFFLGGQADLIGLTASIGFGLILPALLGIVVGRWIRAIPPFVRTVIVAAGMTATTYVFGGSLRSTIASVTVPVLALVALLLVGVVRVAVSAVLGYIASARHPELRLGAAMATAYKNDALAASIALQVGGPLAVLPALGNLVAELALMLVLSAIGARTRAVRMSQIVPETTLE